MPAKDHEYGVESRMQGGMGCPEGDTCDRDLRADARAAWIADVGEEKAAEFDFESDASKSDSGTCRLR